MPNSVASNENHQPWGVKPQLMYYNSKLSPFLQERIEIKQVQSITKERTVYVVPNAISVQTDNKRVSHFSKYDLLQY